MELQPDAVVFSGDLMQTALEETFEWARRDLQPRLATIPTFVVPDNHDVHTWGPRASRRFQRHFSV